MTSPTPRPFHRPLRRTAAAAVAALALTGLAACGGNGSGAGTATDPATTSAAPTAPTAGGQSTAPTSGTDVTPADFVAIYQKALEQATTAHVTLTGGVAGSTLSGNGVEDFTSTPPSAQLTLSEAGGKATTVVLDGGTAYVSSSALGGKYFKIDLKQVLGNGPNLFDPSATLPVLQKYITRVTDVGSEDVDGQTLEHYTLVLDAKGALALLSNGIKLPTGTVPDTLTVQVYFDQDGNLAKMDVDQGAKLGSTSISYSQWGDPVDIKVPAPGQVQQLPSGLPTS